MPKTKNQAEQRFSPHDRSDSPDVKRQRLIKRLTHITLVSMALSGVVAGGAVAKGYSELRERTTNSRSTPGNGTSTELSTHDSRAMDEQDAEIKRYQAENERSYNQAMERCKALPSEVELSAIEDKRTLISHTTNPRDAATLLGLNLPSQKNAEETKSLIDNATSLKETGVAITSFVEQEFGINFDSELSPDAQLEAVQADFKSYMDQLALLPKNSFTGSKVENLLIADTKKLNRGELVRGNFNPSTKTVLLDEPAEGIGFEEGVLYHELIGHAVHNVICPTNSMFNDTSFVALNAPGAIYDPNIPVFSLHGSSKPTEYVSDYAQTSDIDDYAETSRVLIQDLDLVRLAPDTVVDNKKIVALVRLERFFPGFGVYLDTLRILKEKESSET